MFLTVFFFCRTCEYVYLVIIVFLVLSRLYFTFFVSYFFFPRYYIYMTTASIRLSLSGLYSTFLFPLTSGYYVWAVTWSHEKGIQHIVRQQRVPQHPILPSIWIHVIVKVFVIIWISNKRSIIKRFPANF